ncbi:MAG TPA: biopolymer transporter ExbD [Candidatus Sulfotelmatobacter sp.]|nr:biopolymer transporter ExbD [Candidatus Sulfotelmatobacter sp.]
MGALMLRKRTSPRLFSDFNTLQFASVMGMVVFVMLLIFMTVPTDGHGNSVDLPHVSHPVSMPGAGREDAMLVTITRDGKAYFGTDQVNLTNLPAKIQDRLKDRDVERKVYVKADVRARWGTVKLVLDGVRSAGIIRVAFLAYPRPSPVATH